jgi:hypothetical protein
MIGSGKWFTSSPSTDTASSECQTANFNPPLPLSLLIDAHGSPSKEVFDRSSIRRFVWGFQDSDPVGAEKQDSPELLPSGSDHFSYLNSVSQDAKQTILILQG